METRVRTGKRIDKSFNCIEFRLEKKKILDLFVRNGIHGLKNITSFGLMIVMRHIIV